MTFIEKAGLCLYIMSAIVLYSGRELSNAKAAFLVGLFIFGWLVFLLAGNDDNEE